MKFKIAGKFNNSGWRKQMIIDVDKKTFVCGSFLFHSADVKDLTAKQLKDIIQMLKDNDFIEVYEYEL
jgi:hypothetical protein